MWVVVAAAVLGGFLLLLVGAGRHRPRRQDLIQQWAEDHGWVFTTSQPKEWPAQLATPPGHRFILMVTSTAFSRPVRVIEHGAVIAPAGVIHWYVATVIKLTTAHPPLAVMDRGPLSRLARTRFGYGATATGDKEFDRRFRVRTRHPELVSTVLSPALIAEHLAGRVPTWSLAGRDLVTQQFGSIHDPREIPERVVSLMRVADLLDR